MEKDRGSRIIAIAALVVGIVGMSLGFAAFTNDLTIEPNAEVNPANNGKLNVDLSSSETSVVDGNLSGTPGGTTGATAGTAIIDNSTEDAPVVTGMKATFSQPGQTVTYNLYAHNVGSFAAYLRSITINEVKIGETGQGAPIKCVAKTGEGILEPATDEYVQNACKGISISVQASRYDTTNSTYTLSETPVVASFNNEGNIDRQILANTYSGHSLAVKPELTDEPSSIEKITVVISYAADSEEADGAFDVYFGDITLVYSTVDRVVTP